MVISFLGHSILNEIEKKELKEQILSILRFEIISEDILFYLGGYGDFDNLAKECCLTLKKYKQNIRVLFITPYMTESYLRSKQIEDYDDFIFPDMGNIASRLAIVERNKWMVKNSDLLIVHINHLWGGAYKSFVYAQSIGKKYIAIGLNNSKI